MNLVDSKTLDVSCGAYCLPGAIGVDIKAYPGVLEHDLCKSPYPFKDNSFTKIRCQHIIEHIHDLSVFSKELYRVCENNAQIEFRTPHFSSYASWGDSTHLWHFALGSIVQLFDQNIGKNNFQVVKNELKFTGSIFELFGYLIYKILKNMKNILLGVILRTKFELLFK